ncbi:MAG: hypothetical protein K1X88_17635 [Nannocystaceae bacterium]|nr:hypothetical protein [Nannocystaceae bacterium]
MTELLQPAPTGRAKCRACGRAIAKGELRLGERAPNPFGEGDATFWFHLRCGACKRPEAARAALAQTPGADADGTLAALVERGLAHPRLTRIQRIERSPSARARCRHCHETIDRELWRLALDWWEEGRYSASGFVHLGCARAWAGALDDVVTRVEQWMGALDPDARAALEQAAADTSPLPARDAGEDDAPPQTDDG